MSTSVESVKKVNSNLLAKNSSSSSDDDHGSVFAGKNDAGKSNNTKVFNELDTKAKEVIASTIGNNAYMNPKKIAKALSASGITATTGTSQGNTYLEVTNSDGSKSRIWDVGSDGGIGTQDIDLTGQLKDLNNDIKTNAAKSTSAENSSAISSDNKTYSFNDSNNSTSYNNSDSSSNSNANTSNTESPSSYALRYEELKEELKKDSKYKNYSDAKLDEVIKEKLAEE